MEQAVARFLVTQLGYNASADSTLSSNCRGNLKGLWEFIIEKYKTADTARHIQHVLAKHKREQEAALRAPEEQREADARRQRLLQLRKENAELEQSVASLQSRTESRVQEATEQACEHSLVQHALQETQQKVLLMQAFVHRGQQLLPALQARLSHLSYTLDIIKARTKATGGFKAVQAVQQQLAALSSSIKAGLQTAMADHVGHAGLSGAGTDLQLPSDQALGPAAAAGEQQQQQTLVVSTVEALLQQLQPCKLLQGYKLPPDVAGTAMQLLQHPPSLLWELSAQLAQQNLLELTACLDEAQQEMLAPLLWPTGSVASTQQLSDQQQLMARYNDVVGSKHKLPWASGMSLLSAAAMQELGLSPPPEIRVKQRLRDHVQLHVQTEQTIQRVLAAQRELNMVLSGTPLLHGATAAAAGAAAAEGAVASWEGQFAQLFVSIAGLQAQAKVLQQFEQQLEQELLRLQEAREITQDKDLQVRQQMADDEELNVLLHLAAADTMELEAALSQHQARAAQLLSMQLLPCNAAAAEAAAAAVGLWQREAAAVGKLPLQELLVESSSGNETGQQQQLGGPAGTSNESSRNPVLRWTTLSRMQAAGRQLLLTSSATTGAKGLVHSVAAAAAAGSNKGGLSKRLGDTAATAALKGASALDPVAAVRCPASLLLDVSGRSQQDRQMQQQADALSSSSNVVAARCHTVVHEEEQLREQVAQLHERERQEVLPQLQSLLEEGQAARVFAHEQLLTDLKQMQEMPAMHLVPHRTYQGRNCSQWLAELQQWHAKKAQLSTGN